MGEEADGVSVAKSVTRRTRKTSGGDESERRFSPRLHAVQSQSVNITNEMRKGDNGTAKKRARNSLEQNEDGVFPWLSNCTSGSDSPRGTKSVDFDVQKIEMQEMRNASDVSNSVEGNAYTRVKETLQIFNNYYRHFVQGEEQRGKLIKVNGCTQTKTMKCKGKNRVKQVIKHSCRRPDLQAVTEMIKINAILYPRKIGALAGIDVGHQFSSRAEMVAVGLHSNWLRGIDYMGESYSNMEEYKQYKFPLAVSIVMVGQNEGNLDNLEDVVYIGQGGVNLSNKRHVRDQELSCGNLALKNNMEQDVPVRVTHGHVPTNNYVGRVYTYDGLYKVVRYWPDKDVSGFVVFKYQLRRVEGQPVLSASRMYLYQPTVPWSISELHGLVCGDISGGQENIPIPATNIVDAPPFPPSGYEYSRLLRIKENVVVPPVSKGCDCRGSCVDPKKCSCAKLNGFDFPYVHQNGGRLVRAKDIVFECGPYCGCGPGCVNRISQRGLRYRLEVFRTPDKGWAVRSWDSIPSGAPVCEYIGILTRSDELDTLTHDDFVFEVDCLQTMKGLDGRERRKGSVHASTHLGSIHDKKCDIAPEYCIDAGPVGNVARFINHSCEPNLFVQCVLSTHHDVKQARVFLFAADSIPPLQELTYDYGYPLDSVVGPDGKIKKMLCHCGTADCRKWLY